MAVSIGSLALVFSAALAGTPETATATKTPSAEVEAQLPAELDRLLRAYEQAWIRNDADALALLFTEDGFVLQNGKPAVRGRQAIRGAYQGQGGSALRLRALAYDRSGDSGSIIGTYGFGQNETETGKFTLTLRRSAEGKWLIFSDMENMNLPAGAGSEPIVISEHASTFIVLDGMQIPDGVSCEGGVYRIRTKQGIEVLLKNGKEIHCAPGASGQD